MKMKLFRAISFVFVVASLLNFVVLNPVSADAASDQQAVKLIAECKGVYGPFAPNTDCANYSNCLHGTTSDLCTSVNKFNNELPAATNDLKSCQAAKKVASDCISAWQTCMLNHMDDSGKISSSDAQACSAAVAKGDLDTANKVPGSSDAKTDCAVQGIGWIVCPVVNFLAKIVDAAYLFVASLLEVQPLLTTGASQGVYQAWSIMRNFANVAFVIAFMVIIFSQVTSIGITNYGIKRMLPRLIISAILVNLSYWVCAIAVDISNILGWGIKDMFDSLQASLALPDTGLSSGSGWTGIAGGILAGTAIAVSLIYVGLSALLPILLAALLAIVTVFLVLSLRQALIILLVVVAPLAFVAYLLPNTENWFKKWRELLQTLLLMFPIISLIFGASAIASKIVMGTATGKYKIAVELMGAGISIIPLAITPVVMRSAGGILNRFGGWVNNPNKGPVDRLRKSAAGYRQNRQQYRQLKSMTGYRTLPGRGIAARRNAQREAVLNARKSELNRANAGYVAGLATGNEDFRGKLAQGGTEGANERALASAINVQASMQADEVKAASAVIEHANLSSNELNALAKGQSTYTNSQGQTVAVRSGLTGADDATRKAAIQEGIAKGTVDDVEDIIKSSGDMTESQRKVLSDSVAKSSAIGKATHLGGKTIDDIAQGNVTSDEDLDRVMERAIAGGKYSAEKLADNDKDSLKRLAKVLQNPKTPELQTSQGQLQVQNVKEQAARALDDQRISGRVTNAQRGYLESFRTPPGQSPPPPPPNP